MKIKEVLLKEYQTGNIGKPGNVSKPGPAPAAQPVVNNTSNYTGKVQQSAPAGQAAQRKKAPAKSDPAVLARQQELIAAGAKIKADGVMGDKTRAAEKQFGPAVDAAKPTNNASSSMTGATDRFAGQANTDAQTGQNNLGVAAAPAEPAATANAGDNSAEWAAGRQPMSNKAPAAPDAELDRLKQLAIGSNPAGVAPAPSGAAAQQEPAAPAPAPAPAPQGAVRNPMQPNIIEPQDAAMPLPAKIGNMNTTDAARELRAAQAQAG